MLRRDPRATYVTRRVNRESLALWRRARPLPSRAKARAPVLPVLCPTDQSKSGLFRDCCSHRRRLSYGQFARNK